MESAVSRPKNAVSATSLKDSIAEFAAGQISKREIRAVIGQALQVNAAYREAIQDFLDGELKRRRLSVRDHRELMHALNDPLSENIPTEPSADTPEEPGLYRIDGEGTLILSDDFEPDPAPPLAHQYASNTDARTTQKPAVGQGGAQLSVSKIPVGTVLRERFRLDREVASGSMGIVYRATDLLKLDAGANSPEVAIKVINPEFANDQAALKSFQNEVANTQHLSHPNIIHLFELDRDEDHFFITMEWLEGEALDALLDRSKGSALPPVQAYAIIEQLCDALAYAHEHNVVHADVKPGNVFLVKSGELKLIDFGIARIEEPYGFMPEEDRAIALTPAYASCECLEKQTPTAQDDMFSLACLIYRLLSGRRVFGSLTALQAEAQGMSPVTIGGMADGRWQALVKALSFRRENRQPDVQTFAEEFGQRRVPREGFLESAVDDVPHTETMTLQQLPEGVELDLHDTAALSAFELPQAESGSQGSLVDAAAVGGDTASLEMVQDDGAAEIDVEAIRAQAQAQLRGESGQAEILPEPINFFDDDSDDSAFVPIDQAAQEAPQVKIGTGTAELEILPDPTDSIQKTGTGTAELEILPEPSAQNESAASSTPEAFPGQHSLAYALGEKPIRASGVSVPATPAPASKAKGTAKRKVRSAKPQKATAQSGNATVAVLSGVKHSGNVRNGEVGLTLSQRLMRLRAQPLATVATLALSMGFAVIVIGWMLDTSTNDIGDVTYRATPVSPVGKNVQPIMSRRSESGAIESNVGLGPGAEKITSRSAAQAIAPAVTGVLPVDSGSISSLDSGATSPSIADEAQGQLSTAENVSTQEPAASLSQSLRLSTAPASEIQKPVQVSSQSAELSTDVAAAKTPVSMASLQSTSPGVRSGDSGIANSPSESPQDSAYILSLSNLARQAFVESRLVEPTDNSAVYWLGQMRERAPDAMATRSVETQLFAEMFRRAEVSVARGNVDEATYWTDAAAAAGADAARIRQTRSLVSDLRKQNAWQVIAAMEENSGTAAGASTAARVNSTVALSSLEFVDYVEPTYPESAIDAGLTGWVDVSFSLGTDGSTRNVEIIGSDLPQEFAMPSLSAVKQWRFKPYARNGVIEAARSSVRLRYGD